MRRRHISYGRPIASTVVVTTNMFGDILSDEASELCGSLGLGGSINAGDSVCIAQAQHGSAPDIAGKGIANPTSLMLSAAMLLDWLGRRHGLNRLAETARRLEDAVEATLRDPSTRTRDIGGSLGTGAFADAVCRSLTHATRSGETVRPSRQQPDAD